MEKKEFLVYETDASQKRGKLKKIFFPENIEDVRNLIKKSDYITIRGGGSGLVGGAVPQGDLVLDLSKLDKIEKLDLTKKSLIVQAGTILEDIQNYLLPYNLEFPVNPSSFSICTIGGMIATNAVGTRAMKYGRTSDNLLWIEVIDSKGELHRFGKADFGDYVGMEGITGVIVRACLKLIEKKERHLKLFQFDNYEDVIREVMSYKKREDVSAIELLDKKTSFLLGFNKAYSILVEFENKKEEKFDNYLYSKRYSLFPLLASEGFFIIEDPQLILEKSPYLVSWLETREIPFYSHISVGIFHPCFSKKQEKYISQMFGLIKKLGGKISGEHGIGLLKKDFVDSNDKKLLLSIKKRLDPQNKFNRGKII
ncbi:MAG: FAD-binding oxidoreductase [Candidatus Pacearchaeota archaeon]